MSPDYHVTVGGIVIRLERIHEGITDALFVLESDASRIKDVKKKLEKTRDLVWYSIQGLKEGSR